MAVELLGDVRRADRARPRSGRCVICRRRYVCSPEAGLGLEGPGIEPGSEYARSIILRRLS